MADFSLGAQCVPSNALALPYPFPTAYPANLPFDSDPRLAIADEIERLLVLLDTLDGDPDIEANGDELDGSSEEDDIPVGSGHGYPGCGLADPGGCLDWEAAR